MLESVTTSTMLPPVTESTTMDTITEALVSTTTTTIKPMTTMRPMTTTEAIETTTLAANITQSTEIAAKVVKGIEWFLRTPLTEKPKEQLFSPEEIRWIQIQLIITILVVITVIMLIIGCSCLRIPTLLAKAGRTLTHSLRIWKAKLPKLSEWTIWTAIVAVISGIGHCVLCCLYRKDTVPQKQSYRRASEFELVELNAVQNDNYVEPIYATIRRKKGKNYETCPKWPEIEPIIHSMKRPDHDKEPPKPDTKMYTTTAEVHLT